jgi:hypothetical protein
VREDDFLRLNVAFVSPVPASGCCADATKLTRPFFRR